MRIAKLLAALVLVIGISTPAAAQRKAAPVTAKKVAPKPRPPVWVNMVARTPEGGYRMGNPNAQVKLIEYGARTCPTCARFAADAMAPLRANYIATGKVSYEFRDYLVHGAPDLAAALVNQCVPTQRFFPVLDELFANQASFLDRLEALEHSNPQRVQELQALDPLPSAAGFADALGYVSFIEKHGVTGVQAKACLADTTKLHAIAIANGNGVKQGINGTPSFLINGSIVAPYSWAGLEPLLKAAIR